MNTQSFLQEGAELYANLQRTIQGFAADVQAKLEPIVNRRRSEELKALGFEFSSKTYAWHANDFGWKDDGSFAYIGLKCNRPELYWCVAWSGTESSSTVIDVRVGLELPSKDEVSLLLAALRPRTTLLREHILFELGQRSPTDIHVKQQIAPSQMDTVDQMLEQLLIQWISLWNDLGGIHGVIGIRPRR